jgi:hypothetical protein
MPKYVLTLGRYLNTIVGKFTRALSFPLLAIAALKKKGKPGESGDLLNYRDDSPTPSRWFLHPSVVVRAIVMAAFITYVYILLPIVVESYYCHMPCRQRRSLLAAMTGLS